MKFLARSVSVREPSGALRAALVAGVLFLPTDYFMPTAEVFREAGAKPSILAFGLAALVSWLRRSRMARPLDTQDAAWLWLVLVWVGAFAFCVNMMMGWSDFGRAKSPIVQFFTQGALLMMFAAVTMEMGHILRSEGARRLVTRMFMFAALMHLCIFLLEASSLISDGPGTLLGLFRNDEGLIERPTGLMSEPSYFGVFAGLFGFGLMCQSSRGWLVRFGLPLLLVSAALWINAKTVVAVVGLQMVGLVWLMRRRIPIVAQVAIIGFFLAASVFYVTSMATFDLDENLSSVMRLGSSLLGLNVALDGYGWLGIGTGQFHFFYSQQFAPDFLMVSQEAIEQMDPAAPGRASAYNLFIRLLVEGGIVSLGLFLLILQRMLRAAAHVEGEQGRFAFLLILGSLGFLLTQDTYFFPPLCLALAFASALSPYRRSNGALKPTLQSP